MSKGFRRTVLSLINETFLRIFPIQKNLEFESISLISKNYRYKIFKAIISRSRNSRIILIDVGANLGQEIEEFSSVAINHGIDYQIYSFEPVQEFYEMLLEKYSELINQKKLVLKNIAIGENGKIKLHIKDANPMLNDGSSIFKSKSNLSNDYRIVNGSKLSQLLDNTLINENNQVILKIDAEGVEYRILNDLLRHDLLQKISMIFIEDHYHKMRSISWQFERLVVLFKLHKNRIKINNWY